MSKIKKNMILKFALSIFVAIICFSLLHVVYAVDIEELELEAKKYSDKYVEWLNLPEEQRQNTIPPQKYVRNIELNSKPVRMYAMYFGSTSKYNLRDEMSTLKIKNQGNTDQCWAFSTTTQLESYLKKIKNKNIEFSPRHIEYATSRTFLDGINDGGYYREVNSGGNFYEAYAYLASGKGPVLEEDMPFVNTSQKINLSEIQGKQTQAQLEEYKVFPPIYKENSENGIIYTNGQKGDDRLIYTDSQVTAIRNEIKAHIMQYGALGATTATKLHQYFSDQANLYNSKAYYCDDTSAQADHAVTIIGWDDNYSATNFNEAHRPTKNGAWLIQNSYGETIEDDNGNQIPVFDNGLLYISYEDVLIERGIYGIVRVDDVDYEYIYQYDELGSNAVVPVTNSEAYAANVFTRNQTIEYLTEIGLYLNGSKDYTYDVYVNNVDDDLSISKLKKVATISNSDAYYTVIKLNVPIKLSGDKFAVAVRFDCGGVQADIPVEGALYTVDAWYTAKSNAGESFVSADGNKWYDTKNLNIGGINNLNTCIKAFVREDVNLTLASGYYDINNGLIKNVSPRTDLDAFYNNIISNKTLKVFKNDKEIALSELVATGMKLKVQETNDIYKISVRGDVNGDGKITATDLLKLKKVVVNLETLNAEFAVAGDVNSSGEITSTDIVQLKQAMCNLINF